MKELKAFVRLTRLTDIVNNLREEGFFGLTVFEGEGTGHFSGNKKEWSSLKHPFSHSKIAKIEMVIPEERVIMRCKSFMKMVKPDIREME